MVYLETLNYDTRPNYTKIVSLISTHIYHFIYLFIYFDNWTAITDQQFQ